MIAPGLTTLRSVRVGLLADTETTVDLAVRTLRQVCRSGRAGNGGNEHADRKKRSMPSTFLRRPTRSLLLAAAPLRTQLRSCITPLRVTRCLIDFGIQTSGRNLECQYFSFERRVSGAKCEWDCFPRQIMQLSALALVPTDQTVVDGLGSTLVRCSHLLARCAEASSGCRIYRA